MFNQTIYNVERFTVEWNSQQIPLNSTVKHKQTEKEDLTETLN